MTKKHLILKIDDILKNNQFYRYGSIWNKGYADFIDVIDLQVSKSKDMVTINIGVADKFIISKCWDTDGSGVVEESLCTVRMRLGQLLYGRDVWWNLSNYESVEEILSGIHDAAIPFLRLNHSIDHMVEFLENDPAARRYPPGVIYLALLYNRKGESERCREILSSLKLNGAWRQKLSSIIERLN